jgi:hypothetical protein
MDTLIIKVNQSDKINSLIQVLKSMDFITWVDYFDKYKTAKKLFDKTNDIAAQTELSELSMDDIINEIKAYRNEKN